MEHVKSPIGFDKIHFRSESISWGLYAVLLMYMEKGEMNDFHVGYCVFCWGEMYAGSLHYGEL